VAAREGPDGRGLGRGRGRERPGDERRERAPAGGARFFRRHGRALIAAVAFGLIAIAALRGGGDQGTDTATGENTDDSTAADDDPLGTASTTPGTTAEVVDTTLPSTTLVPPDVAHDRPAIDLAAVPDGHDPVEVARWWAANYAVYVGAEGPADLADRLAPLTGSGLLASLRDIPPAASYDAPLKVLGATGTELSREAGSAKVRVSVETDLALVVYDVTLTEAPPGSWLVSRADRV
jgi:hypothetical protein